MEETEEKIQSSIKSSYEALNPPSAYRTGNAVDLKGVLTSIQHTYIRVDSSAHKRLLNSLHCLRTYTWRTHNGIPAFSLDKTRRALIGGGDATRIRSQHR